MDKWARPLPASVDWIVALLAAGLLLGGCASSDGLSSQGRIADPASLASSRSFANVGGKYAGTWPASDWWRTLGDAQLDTLIEEALQGNPDLAVADARARQAAAMAMNADARLSPKLTAQATVLGIRIPGSALPAPSKDEYFKPRVLGLNGSYNIDLWGGQRAAWEAALGQQQAGEVDARASRLTLSVDISRTYTQLGYAWQARDVAQKDAARTQHLLALTTQRVTAGIDSIAQQRQAEALAAASRQRVAQAAQDIESQQIALAILIGKGPDRAAEIARPAPLQTMVLALPENLPADLLGRRPDIVAARWRVEAARRNADASQASFYPSFNLTAAIGLASFHTDDLLSLRSRYYSVAPAISLPIFDGGRLRANLAGSNAEYDIAVAQYNKNLVAALNQVALQIQVSQALGAQEAAQQQSVNAAHEGWGFAMQRYQRGIGSYVEALNAEQLVLETESVLADIRTRKIDAAIQLVYALGGGYGGTSPGKALPATKPINKVSS